MIALQYLMTHESVGPRDLIAIQPLSESTWSRELSQLEAQGLLSKQGGQKRRLTELGRRVLGI
jgi:DNA-binding MarR family transcriptional regulator